MPQPPNHDRRMFRLTPVCLQASFHAVQNKEQASRIIRMRNRKALMEMQKSFAERLSEAQKAPRQGGLCYLCSCTQWLHNPARCISSSRPGLNLVVSSLELEPLSISAEVVVLVALSERNDRSPLCQNSSREPGWCQEREIFRHETSAHRQPQRGPDESLICLGLSTVQGTNALGFASRFEP